MSNVLGFIDMLTGQSAIVVRHAERFDICKADDYWSCGLTEKGMRQAREFGKSISGFDSYRLFYSPVERCRETAENIMSSLISRDGEVMAIAPEKLLGVSYIRIDIAEGFGEADKFGKGFLRAWFDGKVDPGIFLPLQESKEQHLAYLREKFSSANGERHLDIHVTHDWNINVLREGIFGLRHEDAGWPDFLSGLGFAKEPFSAYASQGNDMFEEMLD